MKRLAWVALAGLGLAGCANERAIDAPMGQAGAGAAAAAATTVREPGGRAIAEARLAQVGDSIRVRIEAMGMAPGAYAAHVHTTGRCDAPDFTSAGGHWNPTNADHGKDNPKGMHKGDLPNLLVGTDRRGMLEYTIPNAWVAGGAAPLLDADGAAVVIHAKPDDYRTDPAGNAGPRIACGVLA